MAFDYQLYENGHIVAIHANEHIDKEDIHDMDMFIRNHSHRMEDSVHVVIDLMDARDFPRNVIELKHEMGWVEEFNIGWVIFLSDNHFMNVLIDTAMHLSGSNYLMLDNFEAAMSIVSSEYEMVH